MLKGDDELIGLQCEQASARVAGSTSRHPEGKHSLSAERHGRAQGAQERPGRVISRLSRRPIAESAPGETTAQDSRRNDWTQRAQVLHHRTARKYYAFQRDHEPGKQVGFVYRDEARMCRCSPDGLVGELDGLLDPEMPAWPESTCSTWRDAQGAT